MLSVALAHQHTSENICTARARTTAAAPDTSETLARGPTACRLGIGSDDPYVPPAAQVNAMTDTTRAISDQHKNTDGKAKKTHMFQKNLVVVDCKAC